MAMMLHLGPCEQDCENEAWELFFGMGLEKRQNPPDGEYCFSVPIGGGFALSISVPPDADGNRPGDGNVFPVAAETMLVYEGRFIYQNALGFGNVNLGYEDDIKRLYSTRASSSDNAKKLLAEIEFLKSVLQKAVAP